MMSLLIIITDVKLKLNFHSPQSYDGLGKAINVHKPNIIPVPLYKGNRDSYMTIGRHHSCTLAFILTVRVNGSIEQQLNLALPCRGFTCLDV